MVRFFTRKPGPARAGGGPVCQCGHAKCYHYAGYLCCFERNGSSLCRCQHYVEAAADPTVAELEEWARQQVQS
jgi:hypothetical protein